MRKVCPKLLCKPILPTINVKIWKITPKINKKENIFFAKLVTNM